MPISCSLEPHSFPDTLSPTFHSLLFLPAHASRLSILAPRHDARLLAHPQVLALDHLDRKARELVSVECTNASFWTDGHNLRLGRAGLVEPVFRTVLGSAFFVGVDEVI